MSPAPLDREALKEWYREAMRVRVGELEALLEALWTGSVERLDEARTLGRSLKGSGGSFGFPEISRAAERLENASDAETLRCTEGLVALLRKAAWPGDTARHRPMDWLGRVVGADAADLPYPADLSEAWKRGADEAGIDAGELAGRIASAFSLEVADTTEPAPLALRLVPEALLRRCGALPLDEDGVGIEIATANPTDLVAELELQQVTGRRPTLRVAPPKELETSLNRLASASAEGGGRAAEGSDASAQGDTLVMVVDDDEGARLLARTVLESTERFRVLEAGDGEEALDRLKEGPPVRLLVVDLEMPGMGGRELVRALRAGVFEPRPAVIVLTGASDPQLEADLIEDGADDYISKPLDARLFLARVAATLRRARG